MHIETSMHVMILQIPSESVSLFYYQSVCNMGTVSSANDIVTTSLSAIWEL